MVLETASEPPDGALSLVASTDGVWKLGYLTRENGVFKLKPMNKHRKSRIYSTDEIIWCGEVLQIEMRFHS